MRLIVLTAVLVLGLWAGAATAATFFVNLGTDTGDTNLDDDICDSDLTLPGEQCTLRAAIQQANATPGPDQIHFNLPTGINPILPTLIVFSPLPAITDSVSLDASTQPIFQRVELNGMLAGSGANGFVIRTTDCTVRNFIINRFNGHGILLDGGGGHTIAGNLIGLNAGGTAARPNGADGLAVDSSTSNTIGGVLPGDGNTISGNGRNGILIQRHSDQAPQPAGNVIVGNKIGTNAAGDKAVPNAANGIELDRAAHTRIGDGSPAGRNIISANLGSGVRIAGVAGEAADNAVAGNFIGTDATGTAPLGNGANGVVLDGAGVTLIGDLSTTPGLAPGNLIAFNGIGILMNDVSGVVRLRGNAIGARAGGGGMPVAMPNAADGIRVTGTSQGVVIGGGVPRAGNLIACNGGAGVRVDAPAAAVALLGNSILANTALGIDLEGDGVTPNDPGDADQGANDLQNYPDLRLVGIRAGRLLVDGVLSAAPDADFRLEFFMNRDCDPARFGEGEAFIGTAAVHTGADGETVFSAYLPIPDPLLPHVTATATSADGNTSEFSECRDVVQITLDGLTTH
ncbi:MAG: hypothetical protein Kow0059_15410 [Candidatus Sumerlaeia bacterium]